MKRRRWSAIISRIMITALVLVSVLFISVSWYADYHEKEIITAIKKKLEKHVNGELKIEDISISIVKDFPSVSVVLNGVSLEDTLYHQHKRQLLHVNEVRIEMSPLGVLMGKTRIRKLFFKNGRVDLFTDSNGYSNASALVFNTKKKNNVRGSIPKIDMQNIVLSFEDKKRLKLFTVDIQDLKSKVTSQKTGNKISLQIRSKIEDFSFNTNKGSFLKNKVLSGNIQMDYTFKEKKLSISRNTLKIDKVLVLLDASFSFLESPVLFRINFNTNRAMYHDVISWLSPSISSKISFLKVVKPVAIHALIEGRMQYRDTPFVYVNWRVKDNELMTPVGKMEKTSFDGYYSNEVYQHLGHGDNNSIVVLKNVKATWLLIPFKSDSIKVFGLKQPLLQCNVNAEFPARLLNPVIGGESFLLDEGTVELDVNFNGRFKQVDSLVPSLDGYISLKNASLIYLPRNLVFRKCNALLLLKGTDVVMKDVYLETKKSTIAMEGIAPSFFAQFYKSPDEVKIKWNVNSNYIDFSEFSSFLQPREKKNIPIKNSSKLAQHLDKVLDACTVDLSVRLKKLVYRKFTAQDISADIILRNKETDLQQMLLQQSGGSIAVKGSLTQKDTATNSFNIDAEVHDVNVDQLFSSFENFGQGALTAENFKGLFSAKVKATGMLEAKGKLVSNSMEGKVDFQLKNGALVHFKPLEKVSKFIFKKRNLSYILFKDIHNTLLVEKDKVYISPMLIESSALNMKVSGVYGFDKGTDIGLEIPLRNPQKDEIKIDSLGRMSNKGGLILYLRALDDGIGNVKITWDKSKQHR